MSEAVFDLIRAQFVPGRLTTETTWNGAAFVAGLVNLCRPFRAVEVGAHNGTTSAYIVRALKENGDGNFVAYELDACRCVEIAVKLGEVWSGGPWAIVSGDFFDLVSPDPVDFAFIDIDPKSDYVRVYESLSFADGAVLVAHDATLSADDVHALRLRLASDGWEQFTLPHERGFLVAVKS
jgi:predicted O-methyltransferase YrrM